MEKTNLQYDNLEILDGCFQNLYIKSNLLELFLTLDADKKITLERLELEESEKKKKLLDLENQIAKTKSEIQLSQTKRDEIVMNLHDKKQQLATFNIESFISMNSKIDQGLLLKKDVPIHCACLNTNIRIGKSKICIPMKANYDILIKKGMNPFVISTDSEIHTLFYNIK